MKTLSGGQKRRLDLGVALVGDPELVFLDEPTTGFDPAARRNAWQLVRSLRELGKTVLLTTHYLDEAQQLADHVAVLRAGEIVKMGPPSELIGDAKAEIRYRQNGEQVVLETEAPTRALHELTAAALADGRELEGLEVRRPTLEDVYLELLDGGGRADVSVFAHQLRTEQLVFWRSREAAVFIFIFPPCSSCCSRPSSATATTRDDPSPTGCSPGCSATGQPTRRSPGSRSRSWSGANTGS